MVTVTSFKTKQNDEGKSFCSLQLQGGIESVKGKSGRHYLTARTCWISTTFSEETCRSLVGTTLPGKVAKVPCEPYEYTAKDSGEVITLDFSWEYQPDDTDTPPWEEVVIPERMVIG